MVAAGAGLRNGAAGELLASAWRLRWGAPELSLILADRAAQLAETDAAARLAADAMAVHALDHLGQGVRATVRGVDALRGAEELGADEIGWRLRIDLAATARVVGAPLIGFALLRPVLAADVPRGVRADGLLRLVDCLAHLGPAPELDRVAWEGDRIYATDPSADPDMVALHRARLASVVAAAYRRWGDHPAAERQARAGLEFLATLRDPSADSGRLGAMLTSELVLTLLDVDRPGPAAELAGPILDEPARAPSAAAVGWLRVVLATCVHFPAGRHQLATDLLREAADLGERHDQAAVQAAGLLALAQAHEAAGDVADALESLRTGFAAERRWQWAVHSARVCFAEAFPAANRQPSDWRAEIAALVAGVPGSGHSGRTAEPAPATVSTLAEAPPMVALDAMSAVVAEPVSGGSLTTAPEPMVSAVGMSNPDQADPGLYLPDPTPVSDDGGVAAAHRADPSTFDQTSAVISAPQEAAPTDSLPAEDTHPNLTPVGEPVGAFIDDHPTEPIPVIRDLADAPISPVRPDFVAAPSEISSRPAAEFRRADALGPDAADQAISPEHWNDVDRSDVNSLPQMDGISYAEQAETDLRGPGDGFDYAGRSAEVGAEHLDGFAHAEGWDEDSPDQSGARADAEDLAGRSTSADPMALSGRAADVDGSEQSDRATRSGRRRSTEPPEDIDHGSGRHRGAVGETGRDALATAVALAATRPSRRRRSAEPADDPDDERGPADSAANAESTAREQSEGEASAWQGSGKSMPSGMDFGWRLGSAEYEVTDDRDESWADRFEDDPDVPVDNSGPTAPMGADEVDAAINLSHAAGRLDPAIRDAWLAAGSEPRGLIMFPPGAHFPGQPALDEAPAPAPDPQASPRREHPAADHAPMPSPSPTSARRHRSRTTDQAASPHTAHAAADRAEHSVHLPHTIPSPSPNPPSPATPPKPSPEQPSQNERPTTQPSSDQPPTAQPSTAHSFPDQPSAAQLLAAEPPHSVLAEYEIRQAKISAPANAPAANAVPRTAQNAPTPTAPVDQDVTPISDPTPAGQMTPRSGPVPAAQVALRPERAPATQVTSPSDPAPAVQIISHSDPAPAAQVTPPEMITASQPTSSIQPTSSTEPTAQPEPTSRTATANRFRIPTPSERANPQPAPQPEPAESEQHQPEAETITAVDTEAEPASAQPAESAVADPTPSQPVDQAALDTAQPGTADETTPAETPAESGTDRDRRPGVTRRSRRNGARKSLGDQGPGIADLLAEALIAYETGRLSSTAESAAAKGNEPQHAGRTPTPNPAASAVPGHQPNGITEPVGQVSTWPESAVLLDATPSAEPRPAAVNAAVAPPVAGIQLSAGMQATAAIQTTPEPRIDERHETYPTPWPDTRSQAESGPEHQFGLRPAANSRLAEPEPDHPDTAEPHTSKEKTGSSPSTANHRPHADPQSETVANAGADTASRTSTPQSGADSSTRSGWRRAEPEPEVPKRSYRIPHRLPSEFGEPISGRPGAETADAARPEFSVDSIDGAEPAVIGPPGAHRQPAAELPTTPRHTSPRHVEPGLNVRHRAGQEPDQQGGAETRSTEQPLEQSRMIDLPAEQVWTPPSHRAW